MRPHNSDLDDNEKTAVIGDVVHGHKVGGDMVAGDQYTVDIKDSEAVAIGAGARAEINHYTEIIVKLDTIEDLPPAPGEPPYKGLAYFTEKDAKIYYGRKSLSKHISTRLRQQHFLALIGASGSGKSSLLRAGVIPRLREQNWLIHVITPGIHPLSALTNALARDVNSLDFAPKLEKMMRQKAETLHLIGNKFASRADAPRLLIAVDQFEEVFTQCHDEVERRAFVENLLTAANKGGSVTILIGLRADFYDRCAHFEGLRELVSQQQEFIGPLNQQELVRVIAEPAKQGGWQFVEGLVEQIIEDAGQEPGRLPLLSHALRETWERRRGVAMTLAGYRAAGGVEGAIAKTAEEVLGRFDGVETAVAQSVFLSLTELGEGAEDTRRIASLTELEESNADKPLDGVLQTLINARLITTGDGQVEVAHEALIRRWPRLHGWLADNRERLRFERQLAQDAEAWEGLGNDVGALYRGARLQQAIELVEKIEFELNGRSARFLEASHQETEREAQEKEIQRQRELQTARNLAKTQTQAAQRLRWAFLALAGVAVAMLVIIGILFRPFAQNYYYQRQAEAKTWLVPIVENQQSFLLEGHEISNQQYQFCVKADVCSLPKELTSGYLDTDKMNLPVVGVTAYQAQTYCKWLNRQLPTVSEWQAAYAQEIPPLETVNLWHDSEGMPPSLVSVTEEQDGVVLDNQIFHLVGNAMEWTRSFAQEDGGVGLLWNGALELDTLCTNNAQDTCDDRTLYAIGGGIMSMSMYYTPEDLFSASLFGSSEDIGFRCTTTN